MSDNIVINSTERKLKKLQDRKKKPSAKDMINSLTGKKELQLKEAINSNTYDDDEMFSDNFGGDSKIASLQRRINPQRPLSEEEVKSLIHHDVLDIQTAKLGEPQSNSPDNCLVASACSVHKQEIDISDNPKENISSLITPLKSTESS